MRRKAALSAAAKALAVGPGLVGNGGDEIRARRGPRARSIQSPAWQAVGVAAVARETRPPCRGSSLQPHPVSASAAWLGRSCSRNHASVRAVAAVEAPHRGEQRFTDCGREYASRRACRRPAAPADPSKPARRDSTRPAGRTARRSRRPARAKVEAPSGTTPGSRGDGRKIVFHRLAVPGQHDRPGDRVFAAGRPIVASIELHRSSTWGPHPAVEALARDPLDDRRDDREVHVGISEIIVARAVRGVPRPRVRHRRAPSRRAGSHIGRHGRGPSWCATAACAS